MPHVLKMKDGKLLTPFGIRDLLDAVQDYAGEELRREIEREKELYRLQGQGAGDGKTVESDAC